MALTAVTSQCCVAPPDAPIPGQHRGMGGQKKREEGKTASFLRCHFLELFPRFSDLYLLACSCLCFPLLPAEAARIVLHRSALLRAVCLALPPCRRRLAQAPGCEETQPVSECRGFTFKKHGIIQGGVDLESIICAFSVLFTWHRTESTALLITHSRMCLGNGGLGFCSQRRDRDAGRAQLTASGVESSQS